MGVRNITLQVEKKTLVILAHPQIEGSSSHQFLIQTGQRYTLVDYLDIAKTYQENHRFDSQVEIERLKKYDRIIFQFQLYWYQAPAILKIWMDQVFSYHIEASRNYKGFKGKELGVVVIAGSKEAGYMPGGRHGVTITQLLSPYMAFAKYWQMIWLPYLSIHQFQWMSETDKRHVMLDYVTYLNKGSVGSFRLKQSQLLEILSGIKNKDGKLLSQSHPSFSAVISTLTANQEALNDMYQAHEEEA